MKDTVMVFARAPRLGTVKRRLAKDIGHRAALRFHKATLLALLRSLLRDRRFRTILALTPDGARRTGCRSRSRGSRRGAVTSAGGWTRRAELSNEATSPSSAATSQMPTPPIRGPRFGPWARMTRRLDRLRTAAIGWSRWARRPAQPFDKARWSTEHALADTLWNFRGRRVALLRMLRDVDTACDLPPHPRRSMLTGEDETR